MDYVMDPGSEIWIFCMDITQQLSRCPARKSANVFFSELGNIRECLGGMESPQDKKKRFARECRSESEPGSGSGSGPGSDLDLDLVLDLDRVWLWTWIWTWMWLWTWIWICLWTWMWTWS